MVGGRRPWRECAYVRTRYILHTFFWLCTRATISLFRAKPTVLFRVVVSFGVARITFHVYVDLYHALTRKKYARNFYYCGFWRTFSCRPTSLLLFYSMISCEGELRNGKKYAELAYFMTISGNFWCTKADGLTGIQLYGFGRERKTPAP